MVKEVNSFYDGNLGATSSDREVFNRRIIFDLMLKSKLIDLKKQPGFRDKLANEDYTNSLIEQLLAEFREEKESFHLEEEQYKRERIRQELLLSVSSTEAMYSILKATAPLNAQGEIPSEYQDYMAGMIADSLRSEAGSMSKSSLQKWSGIFPAQRQISTFLTDRSEKEEFLKIKLGKLPNDLTGDELDKLASEHSSQAWLNQSVKFNPVKFSNLDLLGIGDDFKQIKNDLASILAFRHEHDWPYETIKLSA